LGRIDQAELVIRELIAAYPENPAYRSSLIRFLVSHDRKDAAEAELRGIAAKQPANVQLKLDVVGFINAIKGPAAARQELEAMVARQPDVNELKLALAAMLQAMNDRPAALRLIRAIAEKNGDNPDGLKAKAQIAAYQLETGDKVGALKLAEEVLAKDNSNEHAQQLKAAIAIDERKFDQAIGDLRALLRDNPDSPRTLVLLGKAHEMQGTASLAEEQFVRAYQVSKLEPVYGMTYAEFLLRQNQPLRAEKLLVEMIQSRPNLIPALKLLAQARSNLGNWAGVQQAKDEISRLGG
jgi:predicted Zn-dependent protease